MPETPTLQEALQFATHKHEGQVDKAGKPYIEHIYRVMDRLDTEEEKIVAALHDVVEDCGVTFADLRAMGYSAAVLEALEYVTKRPEEEADYDAFIRRVAGGPRLARRVKIADLTDNQDVGRLSEPTEKDFQRSEKYARAIALLEATLH